MAVEICRDCGTTRRRLTKKELEKACDEFGNRCHCGGRYRRSRKTKTARNVCWYARHLLETLDELRAEEGTDERLIRKLRGHCVNLRRVVALYYADETKGETDG